MHRTVVPVKTKRTKAILESSLNKATKLRKLTSSSLGGTFKSSTTLVDGEKKQGEASDGEPNDAMSPSLTLASAHQFQISLSQRSVGPSLFKKPTKPLRRHWSNSKGLQTTLIFQQIHPPWGNLTKHSDLSLSRSDREGHSNVTQDDTTEPQSMAKKSHDASTHDKGCGTSPCLKSWVGLKTTSTTRTHEVVFNETHPSLSDIKAILHPQTKHLCCEAQDPGRSRKKTVPLHYMFPSHITTGQDIAMCEGIQRRRSLRSRLIGGRKRYDKQGARQPTIKETLSSSEHESKSSATRCLPSATTTQGNTNNSVQYSLAETPGSALDNTTRFITASTCASSGSRGHTKARVHHVYAGDRTPVSLVDHSNAMTEDHVEEKKSQGQGTSTSLCSYNGWVVVTSDRMVLEGRQLKCCLQADTAAYGHTWFVHHQQREHRFQPWQMTMEGKVEKLRLGVISMYWNAATLYPISPATVYVSINNFGRLLDKWSKSELEQPTASRWALAAIIAFRLAFKAEERPEIVYEINNIWSIFPMFQKWDIDRTPEALNKMELNALSVLGDSLDVPLGPMFLSLYINAAGYPEEVAKDYRELGLYLLALTSFASANDNFLKNVVPSRLAAAALVLAIKIINGDRACARGMLSHLPECPYPSYLAKNKAEAGTANAALYCTCRYEFYPERLHMYTGFPFEDLISTIKGLSALLRSKPPEVKDIWLIARHGVYDPFPNVRVSTPSCVHAFRLGLYRRVDRLLIMTVVAWIIIHH